ncbi:unnamed protein product [Staurois parvus]|uniref:Endonuclease/exonuclease/phosphatase domain-containing protein n=1 Tax=Staurois parvus TaxID=386267 RepID=A0ABN9CVW6_9NEOB|nr:unnamed protein product [Staurois parvus]
MGRCMFLDVSVRGQDLHLINIYGSQSKWGRNCLLTKIKPFHFTPQQVVFGCDFNTIIRPEDRRCSIDSLGYDSIFFRDLVRQAGLVHVHIKHCPGFHISERDTQSRIERFFKKENSAFSAPELRVVEF